MRGLLYVLFFWPGALAGFAHAHGVDAEDVVDKVIFDRQSSMLLVDYLQTHDMSVSYTHLTLPTKRIV